MTPQEFVACVQKEVIHRNLAAYEDVVSTQPERVTDAVWQQIQQAYLSMNEDQRSALRLIARQAMIDTTSTILGILDGTTLLENYRENFCLSYGSSSQRLNGDLQDYFLASLEETPST